MYNTELYMEDEEKKIEHFSLNNIYPSIRKLYFFFIYQDSIRYQESLYT